MRLSHLTTLAAAAALLATPALAAPREQPLTLLSVFDDAAIPVKLIALLLVAGLLAAPAIAVIRPDTRWLKAIARGALPLGFAAAAYTLLAGAVGIANIGVTPSLPILAPGLAEALMMAMLGLLTAGVAPLASALSSRHLEDTGLA
jgi:hypothetical protein